MLVLVPCGQEGAASGFVGKGTWLGGKADEATATQARARGAQAERVIRAGAVVLDGTKELRRHGKRRGGERLAMWLRVLP